MDFSIINIIISNGSVQCTTEDVMSIVDDPTLDLLVVVRLIEVNTATLTAGSSRGPDNCQLTALQVR